MGTHYFACKFIFFSLHFHSNSIPIARFCSYFVSVDFASQCDCNCYRIRIIAAAFLSVGLASDFDWGCDRVQITRLTSLLLFLMLLWFFRFPTDLQPANFACDQIRLFLILLRFHYLKNQSQVPLPSLEHSYTLKFDEAPGTIPTTFSVPSVPKFQL